MTVMTERPADPPVKPRGVSTGKAAAALGVAHRTLLLWIEQGHIKPSYRTGGGQYRFYLEGEDGLLAQVERMKQRFGPTARSPKNE